MKNVLAAAVLLIGGYALQPDLRTVNDGGLRAADADTANWLLHGLGNSIRKKSGRLM